MENKYLYYLNKLREVFIWSDYEELFVVRADRVLIAAEQDPDLPLPLHSELCDQYAKLLHEYKRF